MPYKSVNQQKKRQNESPVASGRWKLWFPSCIRCDVLSSEYIQTMKIECSFSRINLRSKNTQEIINFNIPKYFKISTMIFKELFWIVNQN
jgi:hypothetical protein